MRKIKNPCNFPVSMINLSLNSAYKWLQTIKLALLKPKKGRINRQDNCFIELLEEEMLDSISLLDTTELNLEIENMFKEEKDFILILSPYLDLTLKIQTILETSPAKVVILWRDETKEDNKKGNNKNQSNKRIQEFINSMPNAEFFGLPYFHSKAYITSKTIIITSLNLYEYSQEYNFELGIVLKETLYNKIIFTLKEKLTLLFDMYKINKNILDNLKLPTVDTLFAEIQRISGKNEKDFKDAELLTQFSKQMMNKFKFDRKDKWEKDKNMLQRFAVIHNREMYEWALDNIRL
jgi:phosphatidylserine/phosphatidylglycerophosphate/cardiolipin synthase-like enzyme